jgi:hypothetical protein
MSTSVPAPQTWVRRRACTVDRAGGQCISDDEVLTHHTKLKGEYINAPKLGEEEEVSVMRGALTVAQACVQRNGGRIVPPGDVERAGVRYATAGDLRRKGFAVIHTCGPKGEGYGHVSVIWPDANPLDVQHPRWPVPVQEDFAACFTEQEG